MTNQLTGTSRIVGWSPDQPTGAGLVCWCRPKQLRNSPARARCCPPGRVPALACTPMGESRYSSSLLWPARQWDYPDIVILWLVKVTNQLCAAPEGIGWSAGPTNLALPRRAVRWSTSRAGQRRRRRPQAGAHAARRGGRELAVNAKSGRESCSPHACTWEGPPVHDLSCSICSGSSGWCCLAFHQGPVGASLRF